MIAKRNSYTPPIDKAVTLIESILIILPFTEVRAQKI